MTLLSMLLALLPAAYASSMPLSQYGYYFDFDSAVSVNSVDVANVINALKSGATSLKLPVGAQGATRLVCGVAEMASAATAGTTIVNDKGETITVSVTYHEGHFCNTSPNKGHVFMMLDRGVRLTVNFRLAGEEYVLRHNQLAKEKHFLRPPQQALQDGDDDEDKPSGVFSGVSQWIQDLLKEFSATENQDLAWSKNKPINCLKVAIDTDVSFTNELGGQAQAATYITGLMTRISTIYRRDLGLPLILGHVLVRTNAATDPYAGKTLIQRNAEMRRLWMAAPLLTHLNAANLVHQLSSTDVGGGRALGIGGLWQNTAATAPFSTSGSMSGDFSAWDIVVVAHELGHNLGAHHTHLNEYPGGPVDNCPSGGANCQRGTIMSYCHQCPGGLANMDQNFHPTVVAYLRKKWVDHAATIHERCIGCVTVNQPVVGGNYLLDASTAKTNGLFVFKRLGLLSGNQYWISKNYDGVWNIATRSAPGQHQRSGFITGMPDGNSPVGGTVRGWGSFVTGSSSHCNGCVKINQAVLGGEYWLDVSKTTNSMPVYKSSQLINGNTYYISKNHDGVWNIATRSAPGQHQRSAFITGMPNGNSPVGGTVRGWGSFVQGTSTAC